MFPTAVSVANMLLLALQAVFVEFVVEIYAVLLQTHNAPCHYYPNENKDLIALVTSTNSIPSRFI